MTFRCSRLLAVIKGLLAKDMHGCIGLQQYNLPYASRYFALFGDAATLLPLERKQ